MFNLNLQVEALFAWQAARRVYPHRRSVRESAGRV